MEILNTNLLNEVAFEISCLQASITSDLDNPVLDTTVKNEDVKNLVLPVEKKGRKPNPLVEARKMETYTKLDEVMNLCKGEPLTISEIVRKIEFRGYTTKTLWTDVYCRIQESTVYTKSGGNGTREKFCLPV